MKPFFTVREMKRGDWGVFAGEICVGSHPTRAIAVDVAHELNGEYRASVKPLVDTLATLLSMHPAFVNTLTPKESFESVQDMVNKALEAYK